MKSSEHNLEINSHFPSPLFNVAAVVTGTLENREVKNLGRILKDSRRSLFLFFIVLTSVVSHKVSELVWKEVMGDVERCIKGP